MQVTPPYDDILDDETLAPLKRNHACLQCKKRKVKCDAVRPTCNPCMRSHAHALRSAQRNKSSPPPLLCTYADDDESPEPEPERERKRVPPSASANKKQAVGGHGSERKLQREKELRTAEERDMLKARIAELEARIAALTTSEAQPANNNPKQAYVNDISAPVVTNVNGTWTAPMETFPAQLASIDTQPSVAPPFVSIETGVPGVFQSFDFSNLLLLPNKWPRNLPSPAILEHLIETFFQCEPLLPRIIHRPTLLMRIRLPPTHEDFPLPAFLHAICAAAAPHTAWINTLNPADTEESIRRQIQDGHDLETSPDFATAQCEAAERSIRHSTMTQHMGHGQEVFDLVRAHLILTETYLKNGMALRGWMTGGIPGRLIKALEIATRNIRKRDKPPLMEEAADDREREERLATVWVAYLSEAGFSVNACWASSLGVEEIMVNLPTSSDEFHQRFDQSGFMKLNPQTAHDDDVLVNHPVPDPFVLVIKASFLMGRVARWCYDWHQRVITPGDELEGMKRPSFIKLVADIHAFQASLPDALKNVYRLVDSGSLNTFSAELLCVHVFPNLALILLHEPFLDWDEPTPNMAALHVVQRAFEAIVGLIHLIPTQLDITLIMTPLLAFSLFTVGRFVSRFAFKASQDESYALAMRWRADLIAINSVLQRYAAKHALGVHLQMYIANHVRMHQEGRKEIGSMREVCNGGSMKAALSTTNTPSAASDTDMGTRSSAASVSGTATTSPAVPHSLGRTPESVDAVDASTHTSSSMSSSAPQLTPDYMQQTLGVSQNQGFDPSLLEFLDSTAAAQVRAALAGEVPKQPETAQSPFSEMLAGLNNNPNSLGSVNGVINFMGGEIPNWNFPSQ